MQTATVVKQVSHQKAMTHPPNIWRHNPSTGKKVQDDPVELHLPAMLQAFVIAAQALSLSQDVRVHAFHCACDQLHHGPLGRCCTCARVVAVQKRCTMQRAGEHQPACQTCANLIVWQRYPLMSPPAQTSQGCNVDDAMTTAGHDCTLFLAWYPYLSAAFSCSVTGPTLQSLETAAASAESSAKRTGKGSTQSSCRSKATAAGIFSTSSYFMMDRTWSRREKKPHEVSLCLQCSRAMPGHAAS